MKKQRWLSWSLAGILSAWLGVAGANPVTLQGEVLQKGSGDPILGASVYVVDNDSINATSDQHGRFTLELPAPGDYTLGAVAVGFESAKQIPITADAARGPIKIYLRQDFTIPPVVVRAERSAERVSKTVITGEELRQVPGAAGDPLRALQSLPGIAGSDFSGEPAIRGSGPEDNAYYVDGVPVGYLFHVGGITSVLPANMVDDFNLYAAAFGPEYDDVTGAVIDVALRKPRTDRLGGKVNVSLISADALIEGPISANQSVMLSARRSYFDFLIGSIEDKESGNKFSFPRYYDYQGKYVWEVNDANTLIVNMNGASDSLEFNITEKSDTAKQEPALVGASSFAVSYHTQNIEWNRRVSATAVNKLYVGHMRTASSAFIGTSADTDVASNELFLREEFRFEPSADHVVTLGGNYSNIDAKLDLDVLRTACVPQYEGYCSISSGEREQYRDNLHVRTERLFAKDRWRVAQDLILIGGLHWTHDDYFDSTYIEPRLGLEWDWTPHTLITAGWGKYNQFPQAEQAIENIGNPNLHRLRATHSMLGMAQKLDAGWSWKLESYYKTFNDLVTSDPQLNYINGGSGKAHGVELLVKKDRSTPWSGWLSVTYSQSRRQIDATGANIPFSFDQPIIATGVLSYKHSANWSYGARWSYHTGDPYTPIKGGILRGDGKTYEPEQGEVNSRRFPVYHRLDVRVDRHIVYDTWKLNTYLEVLNAYNNKSITGYEYPSDYNDSKKKPVYQLPILPYIGVEMEF